jgi:hypothetical protein
MTPVEQITSLYIGYFGRAPDPEGLDYWVGRLADGFSLAEIAESFSVQAESQAKYPYLSNPNIASPQAFITQVYLNLFNRVPDAEGLAYWTAQLEGGADVGDFILDVISGAVTNPDKAIIDNKIEVGADFALKAANEPGFAYDTDAANAAVEVINGVNETDASVAAGKAESDAFFAEGTPPTVSVLTTAIDNIAGTAGADQINGVVSAAPNGTFNTGDTINGGAGEDTLSLIITDGATVTPASLTNVETLVVQDLSGGSINLVNATGLTTIASNNSSADTSFSGLGNIVDLRVSNSPAGADLFVSYDASVVAGVNDTQDITFENLNGGGTTFVNVNGIEQLNVTAIGDNVAGVDGSPFATVNTLGAGNLVYANFFGAPTTTFNAAAATGDIAATFSGNNQAVTGGAGDDVFNFLTTLTADDTVNGGAGVDSVQLDTAGISNFSAAADAAGINAITNVERLSFYGANGVTINGATFQNSAVTNLQFATDGGDIINNAGSARTYEFADLNGTSSNGDATFNMNGTSTTLNISLLGTDGSQLAADDGNSVDIDDLFVNLSGVQPAGTTATINIVSNGDLADSNFNDIDTVTTAAGSTVNVSGTGNLELGGFADRAIINASALTGDLNLFGSNFAVGALPADFESGADVITLGQGDNVVNFGDLSSGVGSDSVTGTYAGTLLVDVVNGFTAGANGDVLNASNSVAFDADYTALTAPLQADINLLAGGAATLRAAADIAASAALGDEWTAFTFQGQTYAMYDADAATTTYDDANDVLVQITGVTVANLTDANFA